MERETIYLAALLHDIGKFWQRADPSGSVHSEKLSSATKNNIGLYCPQYKGNYSHKHVLWTAEFLDRHKPYFVNLLGSDVAFEQLFKATVKHHCPDQSDVFQLIVQKADHYASGADRTTDAEHKDSDAENSWDAFKNVRMVSIFEGLGGESQTRHEYRIPIEPLTTYGSIFPTKDVNDANGQKKYAALWDQFESSFSELITANSDILSFAESLTFLLYRYAHAVPSSTIHLPDVSLYDHLKSTGIMAVCLHDYLAERGILTPGFKIQDDEEPLLLVGGDLSGIQNYIYDIVSTEAARNLKGRSFYLQILVENTVEIILKRLELPWASVVYASGGGFYLLAPNTKAVVEKLTTLRKELAEQIFLNHKTNLSLAISWKGVSQRQLLSQNKEDGIHSAWAALAMQISAQKTQKFKDQLVENFDFFFKPSELGGAQQRDFITGEEFSDEETASISAGRLNREVFDLDDGKLIKSNTKAQIDLGSKLRKTNYWITSETRIKSWVRFEFRIGAFPLYNYLLSDEELATNGLRHPDQVFIRAFSIDHFGYNSNSDYLRGRDCIYGFTFYGGNDYPVNANGNPVTFDQMATLGEGTEKLGVLRMDVDNLGTIFISGIGTERRTFSRYSTLSRNLDFFFKGYLNYIWKKQYADNSFIIYSGGDDLFIVGHWSAVFNFAKDIRREFKRWVCNNEKLTISGGVAIVGGKFPISKGAVFAAEAEKKAKNHHLIDSSEKNAFAVFDMPLNWDYEFDLVESVKNELVELIQNQAIPRGILQRILQYAEQARLQEMKGGSTPWRWRMAYDFSRAAGRKKDTTGSGFYEKVKEATITEHWDGRAINALSKHKFLSLLEAAARWAELATKIS
jgi:CRISPR-associated protein Csm1